MTTFYCVRHGKTVFNQQHVFQGGTVDSPLLAEGREGAVHVGKFLKKIPFDLALVSPQKRAQDTAQLLLSQHSLAIDCLTVDDLCEMKFGQWDGLPEQNFHHEKEFQHLVQQPDRYDPSAFGGETFATLIDRGQAVFINAAKKYPNDTILVVAHGLFLQTILKSFQGIPLADIRKGAFLDNTSVSIISCSDNGTDFQLDSWNDTSFIPN